MEGAQFALNAPDSLGHFQSREISLCVSAGKGALARLRNGNGARDFLVPSPHSVVANGTLVDTAPDIANAVNRLLATHGLPPQTVSFAEGFIGEGSLASSKSWRPQI